MPRLDNPEFTLNIDGVPAAVVTDGDGHGWSLSWPEDGPSKCEVTLRCRGRDLVRLLAGLRGYVKLSTTGVMQRTPPWPFPPSPNLIAMSIGQTKGWGGFRRADGFWDHEYVDVPVTFGVPTFKTDETQAVTDHFDTQPYTTIRTRVSGDVIQPPGGTYWVMSTTPSDEPAGESQLGFPRALTEITLTRHMLERTLIAGIELAVNHVNDRTIHFYDQAYPAGHVLFLGADTGDTVNVQGASHHEATYTMIANPHQTWNKGLSRDGNWYSLNSLKTGSGVEPFAGYNFWNIP